MSNLVLREPCQATSKTRLDIYRRKKSCFGLGRVWEGFVATQVDFIPMAQIIEKTSTEKYLEVNSSNSDPNNIIAMLFICISTGVCD